MPWAGARKALAECEQQLRVALQADLSRDHCRYQAPLLRQKAEPGLRVCRDVDVRLADKAVGHFERSILDPDRRFAFFGARKGEVDGGIEPARLVWLEDVGHEVEQPGNRARPEATADGLHRLVLELSPGDRFGIGARHYVDGFGPLLQRLHDLLQVALLILQIGADDIFAGRTYGHTVGRLVVGPMAKALPHGRG